jgi:cytochrome c2
MRLIAVALLAGTSLALTACGSSADESAEPTAAATDTALATPAASPLPSESATPSPSPSATATPTPTPTPKASPSAAAASGGMAASAPAGPPVAFAQCKMCHSVEKGDHGIGPSLAGVFGTKAGDIPGYQFSDAMKNSGLTWNAANLDKFLENPRAVVPGTKMAFAGIKDAAKREAVVDYLKTL